MLISLTPYLVSVLHSVSSVIEPENLDLIEFRASLEPHWLFTNHKMVMARNVIFDHHTRA